MTSRIDSDRQKLIIGNLSRIYLDGMLDPFMTLHEVHKLLYFMQAAGEPLGLKYVKTLKGPCANNIFDIFDAIGWGAIGEHDFKEDLSNNLKNLATDFRAYCADPRFRMRLKIVEKIIDGFQTPFGLQLLSTVLWLNEPPNKLEMLVDYIGSHHYAVGSRKFSKRQISLAADALNKQGWIDEVPA